MTCTKKISPTTMFPMRSLRTETSFAALSPFATVPVVAAELAWGFMRHV